MKEIVKFSLFLIAIIIMWFIAFGNISFYKIEEPDAWPPAVSPSP